MSELPVKKEFEWNKIGSWRNGNPYTITFIYPRRGTPFALKGGMNDVEKWLKENMANQSYVVHHTLFCSSRPKSGSFIYPAVEPHRSIINVNLVSDKFIAFIDKTVKKVEIGKDPDFGYTKHKWLNNGHKITVYQKSNEKWRRKGEQQFEKKIKRVPRCFPKELMEFCND